MTLSISLIRFYFGGSWDRGNIKTMYLKTEVIAPIFVNASLLANDIYLHFSVVRKK